MLYEFGIAPPAAALYNPAIVAGPRIRQHVAMFGDIPSRVWILLALAVIAGSAVQYIVRHIRHDPAQRDVTKPSEDLSWRTTRQFYISLVSAAGCIAIAIFIFTPSAEQVASAAWFTPAIGGIAGFAILGYVARGILTGKIQSLVRGAEPFERDENPAMFWLAIAFNLAVGVILIGMTPSSYYENLNKPLVARCNNWDNKFTPQESIEACNSLIASEGISSDTSDYLLSRGIANMEMSKYDAARLDLIKAYKVNQNDPYISLNLGIIEQTTKNYRKAIDYYSDTIGIDQDNFDAYFNRGIVHTYFDERDPAIADFTKAHELKPDEPWPLAERGFIYALRKDKVRANADFAAVRKRDPTNPVMLRGEGLLARTTGDCATAITSFTEALKREPNQPFSLEMRAQCYEDTGQMDNAQRDRQRLKQLIGAPTAIAN